uniref:Uncharacterized protein n=1 Tax=Arundo donax TaxID=35708 RepID=A0A0A9AXW8_ARUDO
MVIVLEFHYFFQLTYLSIGLAKTSKDHLQLANNRANSPNR